MARSSQPSCQAGEPEQRGQATTTSQISSRRHRLGHAGDRDDSSAGLEHRSQTRQRVAAEQIGGTVIARKRILKAFARVVDDHIGAESFDERLTARRGCRRHAGTQVLGDLDRKSPNSACATRNEYVFAGDQVQLVAQRLQRRERGERHSRNR